MRQCCRTGTRPADWLSLAEAAAEDAAVAGAGPTDADPAEAGSMASAESPEWGAQPARPSAEPGADARPDGEAGAYGARVAVAEAAEPRGWWGRRRRRDHPAPAQPTGTLCCTCAVALHGTQAPGGLMRFGLMRAAVGSAGGPWCCLPCGVTCKHRKHICFVLPQVTNLGGPRHATAWF